jgi:hypothetical protein
VTLTYGGKYDGAFGSFATDGGPNHQLVSEEFMALLTEAEKRHLQFQPVIRKGRRKFFELIGPEGPPHVGVGGMKVGGWHCAECGHRSWGYWIEGMTIHSFVASSDLSPSLSGVFTVGVFPEIELAVTASRWSELLGRKGTRGFTSRPLGVVPDHEVVREPELPGPVGSKSDTRSMPDWYGAH